MNRKRIIFETIIRIIGLISTTLAIPMFILQIDLFLETCLGTSLICINIIMGIHVFSTDVNETNDS